MGALAQDVIAPPFRLFPQSRRAAHREAIAINMRMCGEQHNHLRLLPPDDIRDVFCRCGEDMTV